MLEYNSLSISACIRLSQPFRGWPRINRTTVRDVPNPLSPAPAPFRLRGCEAHVVLISILRSNAESMEKTPRSIPAGGTESKSSGGNVGGDDTGRGFKYG